MTIQQNEHLSSIKINFSNLVEKKYSKGAEAHGGNLWQKKDLIDMAIDEAIDQVVYLLTLKEQIDNKTLYSVNGVDKDQIK